MGHRPSVGKVRVQTTHSQHTYHRYPNLIRGVQAQRPNHIWVADITYIRYGRQFLYLAVILDACTRGVRGWHLSDGLDAQTLTVTALQQALAHHDAPRIFHSDQGVQYACWQHIEPLLERGVHISMSDTGEPTQNGLVERFIRTLKEEHVDYTEYRDYEDALVQLWHWLEVEYMTERIHSALDYQTPLEFELVAWANPPNPLLLVR
jgi:transposase InsO family protein